MVSKLWTSFLLLMDREALNSLSVAELIHKMEEQKHQNSMFGVMLASWIFSLLFFFSFLVYFTVKI